MKVSLFKGPVLFWLVLSCFFANMGAGMALLTLIWSAILIRNQVSTTAELMFFFWLPSVILAPVLGPIIDTYSRKAIVSFTLVARILFLLIIAGAYSRNPSFLLLSILATGMGLFAALYTPTCMAMVREVVRESELLYANTRMEMALGVGFLGGMPLSGFLINRLGSSMTLTVTACCFFLALLCIFRMKNTKLIFSPKSSTRLEFWQESYEGLRYLKQNPLMLSLYLIQLLIYVVLMTTGILLAPFVSQVLRASSVEYGAIDATLSLGSIAGAFLLPRLVSRWGDGPVILLATFAMTGGFVLFAMCDELAHAMVIYFVIGIGLAAWPVVTTSAQSLTQTSYQGRVQTVINAMSGVLILLMYGVVGGSSLWVSVRWSYVSIISICALATLLTFIVFFKMVRSS